MVAKKRWGLEPKTFFFKRFEKNDLQCSADSVFSDF